MQIPFSIEEFLGVFRTYNLGVWPAQIGLYGLGLLVVALALAGARVVRRWGVAAGLALLWVWMGAVYHLNFFVGINPAARGFGALFLAQAALWIVWAWRTPTLDFRPLSATRRLVGTSLLAYAFFVYPLLNVVFGHGYPEMPTFGLPCPTTIATFGLAVLGDPPTAVVRLGCPCRVGIHRDECRFHPRHPRGPGARRGGDTRHCGATAVAQMADAPFILDGLTLT